jgi:acyl carrier protein
MDSIVDFVVLIRDELGLALTVEDTELGFDDISGWDSMFLLWLVAILERKTGRRVTVPDVLEAENLKSIYMLTR